MVYACVSLITDHLYSTRKCFFPFDLTELDHLNSKFPLNILE